jgi:hypothetical protein
VAGGAGIGDAWNGTLGIALGIEGMIGMEGIGGSVVGIVVGMVVGIVVGILGIAGMAGIGGCVVGIVLGIVTFGIEGIGGKVVGIAGMEGIGGKVVVVVGIVGFVEASGAAVSVVSKRWRAARLPSMAVKAKTKASIDQSLREAINAIK